MHILHKNCMVLLYFIFYIVYIHFTSFDARVDYVLHYRYPHILGGHSDNVIEDNISLLL